MRGVHSLLAGVVLTVQTTLSTELAAKSRAEIANTRCKEAPPSKNRRCAVKGRRRLGDLYATPRYNPAHVSSAVECAYLCARRARSPRHFQAYPYCASFEYNAAAESCTLLPSNVSYVLQPKYTGKPRLYYDLGCYDCGDLFCDTEQGQPYGAQLLDNGGFDDDYLGPWLADGFTIKRNISTKDVYLQDGRNGIGYGYAMQDINLCNREYYELLFYYKYRYTNVTGNSGYPSSTVHQGYRFRSEFDTGLGRSSDTDGKWVSAGFVFQANAYDSANGGDDGLGGPSYQLDKGTSLTNATISRRPPEFLARPGAKSIILNGNFESGKAAPWMLGAHPLKDTAIRSPGLNGSKYAAAINLNDNKLNRLLTQPGITTKAATWYLLSVTVRNGNLEGPKPQPIALEMSLEGQGTRVYKVFEAIKEASGTQSWPFFVSGTETQFGLRIYGNENNKTTVFVDDVNMVELGN